VSRDRLWLAPLLLAAGVAIALVLFALAGRDWQATALVEARGADAERAAQTAAELVDAEAFLARVQPQVLAGRLSADELADRVDARVPDGTSLVEIRATASEPEDASALARDLAGSLVASSQARARQDAELVEAELRTRIAQLEGELAAAPEGPEADRLARARAALERQAALAAASAAERALVVAASPADADETGPSLWHALVAGLLLGLVLAAGALLLGDPRPRAAPPVARPSPRLVEPAPGAVVSGLVTLRAEPEAEAFEASADGAVWTPVDPEWDTSGLPDGRRAVRPRGGPPVTVVVDNVPPSVVVVEPTANAEVAGLVHLVADARDDGSGIASVSFLLSDGSPEWRAVEAENGWWETDGLAPGTYWLCAAATDRAGHRAASELVPVRVA
jgi:hypothetical protein